MALTNFLFKSIEIEQSNISPKGKYDAGSAPHLARKILLEVMQFRRVADPQKSCAPSICEACFEPHIPQIISAIEAQQPITFVLPAFPGKSPNLAKVLGALPDMAERCSLEFLNNFCKYIQKIYSPGAEVILCSDGRVFNDVIGIRDADVTDYQQEILQLIKETPLPYLSTFNLDDVYSNLDFNQMRDKLMAQYGEPLENLKDTVRKGSKAPCSIEEEEVNRQYCGITRFLVEDATHPEQSLSRNALQKICRRGAYIVVQRSRAWSELVAERFPHAVRLSIHPQICGTSKLGIRLMEAENWMTPWHGVAVEINENFVLLKRAQAEALRAQLVYREGRPSHYQLLDTQGLEKWRGVVYGN